MTRQLDGTLFNELMQLIAEQGLDAMPELYIITNAAMQALQQQYLRAAPYERTSAVAMPMSTNQRP